MLNVYLRRLGFARIGKTGIQEPKTAEWLWPNNGDYLPGLTLRFEKGEHVAFAHCSLDVTDDGSG